jgi:hypothetical protein
MLRDDQNTCWLECIVQLNLLPRAHYNHLADHKHKSYHFQTLYKPNTNNENQIKNTTTSN